MTGCSPADKQRGNCYTRCCLGRVHRHGTTHPAARILRVQKQSHENDLHPTSTILLLVHIIYYVYVYTSPRMKEAAALVLSLTSLLSSYRAMFLEMYSVKETQSDWGPAQARALFSDRWAILSMSFLYRRIDRATWASAAKTTKLTAKWTGRPRLENLRLCSLGYDPNMFRLLSHAHMLWGRLLEMRYIQTLPVAAWKREGAT